MGMPEGCCPKIHQKAKFSLISFHSSFLTTGGIFKKYGRSSSTIWWKISLKAHPTWNAWNCAGIPIRCASPTKVKRPSTPCECAACASSAWCSGTNSFAKNNICKSLDWLHVLFAATANIMRLSRPTLSEQIVALWSEPWPIAAYPTAIFWRFTKICCSIKTMQTHP